MPFPFDFAYNLEGFSKVDKHINKPDFRRTLRFPDFPNWKQHFISGLNGIISRMESANFNYYIIHSWDDYFPKGLMKIEGYLASILFNLDSALECCVYALNSLGCAIDSTSFYDINSSNELLKISPRNIIGKTPRIGYSLYFKNISKLWIDHSGLIKLVVDHHDVTKHRHFNLDGGNIRSDPPAALLIKYGVKKSSSLPLSLVPFEKVLLGNDPKLSVFERIPSSRENLLFLEDLSERYVNFIQDTGTLLMEDILSLAKQGNGIS